MDSPNPPQDIQSPDLSALAKTACESATQVIRQYPIASALAVAGVGVGVGLLLSKVAKDSPAISSVLSSEEVGQQIMQAVSKAAPDILSQFMQSR